MIEDIPDARQSSYKNKSIILLSSSKRLDFKYAIREGIIVADSLDY